MKLTTTMQNHLRGMDSSTFTLLQKVSRLAKNLYNAALYIQRQQFFATGKIFSLSKLFHRVKQTDDYLSLSSDLAQQTLILVNRNFRSFFRLLKLKKDGKYTAKVRLPHYLDKKGHFMLSFIPRQFRLINGSTRLSLGRRGKQSTGVRFFTLPAPPLGIDPKQIRIIPRYDALFFDIEYVYDIQQIQRSYRPDSYLSIDLGLDNFATCTTTDETAFIIEGKAIKSFNRWWNKNRSRYQSTIARDGIKMSKRLARMQQYRSDVVNNYLNHVVNYIITYCMDRSIGTIIVGEWADMKRSLKMHKHSSQLFQTLPYRKFKQKLQYKATLYSIKIVFQDEAYTSQDCFACDRRRKANRVHRGLYNCDRCEMVLNADVNGSLNIMKNVVPEYIVKNIRWNSGDITSPSRIRLVEFV